MFCGLNLYRKMACFEDFAKKKDIMNNAEDEDLLIKSNKVSPNLSERPLSPILTGGLNNRKFMIGKRLSCKKSARVKLSDRFKDNNKEEYFVVKPVDVPIPVSFEDSLSASQTETLINHLDKLEELDNSRRNIYNALVRDIEASNDSFKRPISLAPYKVENIKINNVSQNVENESILQRFILDEVTPISPKKLSVGFQTAKGKNISISETDIKKCSKLFQDIIYPAQNYSEGRQNKHTFLRKNKSFKQNNSEVIANFFSNDSLKCSKPDKDIKSMQSNPLETSLTTSKLSAKLIENKHIFEGEEFGDIKFNNENLCGFKKANFQAFESTDASKETVNILDCDKDVELTLTQAICESGISNTQIISAVDNILESIEGSRKGSFIGFTKDDMTDSYERYLNLKTLLEHDHLIHGLSKKRKRSIFSVNNDHHYNTEKSEISPPCKKRLLNFENIQYKANCIENNENNFTVSRNNFGGFTSASGKSITISEKYVKSIEAIFSDIDFNIPSKKFKPDSQKNIYSESNEENSPKKAKNIFNKLDAETSNENLRNKLVAPESTSSELTESNIQRETHTDKISFDKFAIKPIDEEKCVPNYYNTVENPFTSCNNFMKVNFNNCAPGFCKASGKTLKISENALKKAKNLFENLSMDNSRQDSDRTLVAQTSTTSAENVKGEQNYLMNALVSGDTSISKKFSLSDELSATEVTPLNLHKPRSTSLSAKNSKKKLGMSHFKQIQICDNKLDKAKSLFDEDFSGISPIKPRQCVTYTSTPIKQNNYMASVQNDCIMPKTSFNNFVDTAGITPIKMDPVEIKQPDIPFNTKTKILCTCPSKDTWIDDLEAERKKLELKLQIFLERERLGREMLNLIKNGKSDGDKKPRKGLLYRTKTTSNKVSLVTFVNNRRPGEFITHIRVPISSKNAKNLHFEEQFFSSLSTEDGAVVIPNSKDMVGLSEITNAFEAMPGVETRLIPKGWMRNHYKWIVWKLTSYENMFPNHFGGCLNIENIMQQLKYRYDREIDRAERPALRKICEKDDAPQKRMVLCVSDVKMLDAKKYELELCDGWYAVRTIIDEPLCNQISKGKIEIGTKLLISGAELLNCDGCHLLEATNLVCLKINYNCTRRSIWHAKLGFQRNPNPFPIQLQSVHHLGGTIAAIKVCVIRVYPLRYMEKLEGRSVWRNRKAEEIAAQKWENERSKKLEQIQHEVIKKFESFSAKSVIQHQSTNSDVSNIRCPKELYDILQKSNDPEYLQQNLSVSQKEAVLNYQSSLSMKKQQEMAAEVSARVSKLKLKKRDVVAMLKLVIIDVLGGSDRLFNFSIWRPTEAHLQSLREGKSFTIQNVLPRPNGDLNSTSKTIFKLESISNDKYNKYKRCLVQIAELATSNLRPDFDTIGIVIQTKTESHKQEVWIADNVGRLLFITIYEGPDTCSLIDNVKRGQATTVCNLIYRGLKKDIVQAVANHFTVFSSYSQYKHLQEGLEVFKKQSVKDVNSLLDDCDSKIEVFRIISDINSFSANFDTADEEAFTSRSSLPM